MSKSPSFGSGLSKAHAIISEVQMAKHVFLMTGMLLGFLLLTAARQHARERTFPLMLFT
jgi:hypothetical protein